MWVFIVLLLTGFTIITVRMFRNAALEEESAALAESEAAVVPAPVVIPPAGRRSRRPIAAEAAGSEEQAAPVAPYPPPVAEHAGGPCPSCGSDTVPGAKFCGECGMRLVS